MNAFLRRHKKLHIWLAVDLEVLLVFLLVRERRDWMNALAERVTGPLKKAVGQLCYRTEFSVMEALLILAALAAAVWLAASAAALARSRHKAHTLYSALLALACAGLTVYLGFCWLWGVNYYTDSFQDKSGVYAREVSVEELYRVTDYFAGRLAETADMVARDGDGVFAESRESIMENSTRAYTQVSERFPFLSFDDRPPKAVYFSRIMSRMNFTGVYCPYTGESNVNVDSPACLLPSTIAHELAHQRGVASEQECNFLAVLASTTCGDPVYEYSGWLLGYIHLSNALYRADKELYRQIRDRLPEGALADMRTNDAYWARFRDGAVSQTSQKIYDSFLKGYGETRGIRSYGTVVDLLVVWYDADPAA